MVFAALVALLTPDVLAYRRLCALTRQLADRDAEEEV